MIKSNQYDVKIRVNELRSSGFTSLDTLQGKVYLNLRSDLSINCIQLKFRGIDRSSIRERTGKDKVVIKEESHILFDDIQTIFPKRSINEDIQEKKVFNLKPGEYQYDFQFKVALNSSCCQTNDSKPSRPKFIKLSSKSSSSISINDQHHNSANNGSNGAYITHTKSILPPTFQTPDSQIEYYLKVVIIRSSVLKSNIKRVQNINFLPFNGVEYLHKSKMLNYVRKEVIFKDKLPEIIAIIEPNPHAQSQTRRSSSVSTSKTPSSPSMFSFKSFFFGSSAPESPKIGQSRDSPPPLPAKNTPIIDSFDVPFYFEARSFGFIQTLGKPLNLKFLLLSKVSPKRYLGIDGNPSGLGSIYLQKVTIDLVINTKIKAQDLVKENTEVVELCDLKLGGYKLELSRASKSKAINERTGNSLYELEIPQELFSGIFLPDNQTIRSIYNTTHIDMVPSFKICNIERSYKLNVSAWLTETKQFKSPKQVDLDVPISVISGIDPPVGAETLPPPTRSLPSYEEVVGASH